MIRKHYFCNLCFIICSNSNISVTCISSFDENRVFLQSLFHHEIKVEYFYNLYHHFIRVSYCSHIFVVISKDYYVSGTCISSFDERKNISAISISFFYPIRIFLHPLSSFDQNHFFCNHCVIIWSYYDICGTCTSSFDPNRVFLHSLLQYLMNSEHFCYLYSVIWWKLNISVSSIASFDQKGTFM